jgi:O-antigen/teichoic acid export membrane protein
MTTSIRLTVAKNAAANVARGSAAALVALAVPPFLTRLLPPEKYGAWSLVLQLAAYVSYFEFGIQTAVGRFVARENERGEFEHRNKIVNTALALLSVAGLLALILIALVVIFLPRVFRGMPAGLYLDVRIALALVGGSLAVGLPASVFSGIFVGLQRYEIPAAIVAGSRIVSGLLLVAIAQRAGNITAMAVSVAAVNLGSCGLQWFMYRRIVPDIPLSLRLVSRHVGRELAGYCFSLSVWSFSMLLVSGLDLTLVGVFDFQKVAFYAVAANLVIFIAGLQNAIFHATMPSAAVLQARGASLELGRMVIDGTRYGMFLLLLTGLPLLLAAKPILKVWVGPDYAAQASLLLKVLVIANVVRLSTVPYIVALVGTGQQRLVVFTPLLEGFTNLGVSVFAGYYWGAAGVALGTFCGALVGLGGIVFYNMPRTTEIRFSMRQYLLESLLRPILCALPLVSAILFLNTIGETRRTGGLLTVILAGTATAYGVWRWGLMGRERQRLRALAHLPVA